VSVIRRCVATAAVIALGLGATGCGTGSDSGDGASGRKKIALLLPDVQATRYDRFDVPYFSDKVEQLCPDCEIIYRNAAQLPQTQEFQADEALENGADVLVLAPVDAKAAANIVKNAKGRNVPVISYDRLVENADIDYYISFNNEKVGKLQATALVQRLTQTGKTAGRIVMINGSDTDNNAKQFNRGAHSILDNSGFELTPKADYFTPEWDPAKAQTFMADQIAKLAKPGAERGSTEGMGFVGVYAANDGMAGGAIAAMSHAGIKALPPITGQDAELPAIQRILTGEQFMTVYKAYRPEAERAAEFAVALVKGQKPQAPDKVNNGRKDVPSLLLEPTAVTLGNIETAVVEAGLYSTDELCVGAFVQPCRAAGLTSS
jgi:D-xylose transport system substrate-binding protein